MIRITKDAASELLRQSVFSPDAKAGRMFLSIVPGGCSEWSILISSNGIPEIPISREGGVTLYTRADQASRLKDLTIDYKESLAGGSFYFYGESISTMPCGTCFSYK